MQSARSASPRHRAQGALLVTLVLAVVALGFSACGQSATATPAQPTWVGALPGNGAEAVGWGTPSQPVTVTDYVATAEPGGSSCKSDKVMSCWVRGLANGKAYTISVRSVGPSGQSSAISTTITPGVPWPPNPVTAIPGDGSAAVSWSPAHDLGGPVTSYTVQTFPSGDGCTISSMTCSGRPHALANTCTTATTTCTVVGLVNDTTYTFVVTAHNVFGHSAPSGASPATTPSTTAGGTPGIIFLGPVNANSESTTGTTLQRDAGISVALPNGRDLWIFGDTSSFSADSDQSSSFIGGSTAAKGRYIPGESPTALKDVEPAGTSPSSAAPTQFIPTPTDTYMPGGSGRPCTTANGAVYTARWPTGAALLSDERTLLVTYTDVCVTSATSFTVEGWGFMTYLWRQDKIKTQPYDVFPPSAQGTSLPTDRAYQSPVVANGQVTFFTSNCTSLYIACTGGSVSVTTVSDNVLTMAIPSNYVSVPAVTDGSAPWMPVNVSIAAYPYGLRLIEQTSIGGTFIVFSATSPTGPWHAFYSGTLPGCSTTPTGFCYAFVGHPELSSNTSIVVSYFKPDSPGNANVGHVDLALVPLTQP
jgi:Fibronectin type III domain